MSSTNLRTFLGFAKRRGGRVKSGPSRQRIRTLIGACSIALLLLALLLFSNLPAVEAQGPEIGAADLIQRAWNQARDAGAYAFDAEITQIRRPLATVTNVGRQAERERMYLEGQTELDAERLEMTMWMNGGAVSDPTTGAQIRVEGEQAYARQGGQTWEEIDNFAGLFAPDNDFMTYLVAATNVVNQGQDSRAGIGFTRLTFEIDGPAYSAYMRDQVQAEMARRGELPTGIKLAAPEMYSNMSGSGELWIGEDGLPMRQILQLDFPPDGDEQVSAQVTVNFRDFNPAGVSINSDNSTVTAALNKAASIIPGVATADEFIAATKEAADSGSTLLPTLIMIGFFVGTLYYARRSRKVLAGLQITLIFSLLFGPLLRSVHAAQFSDLMKSRNAAAEERDQSSGLANALQSLNENEPAGAPGTVADIQNDSGLDTDGDGFTDVQEMFLGTNPSRTSKGMNYSLLPPTTPPLLDVPTVSLPANDSTDSDGDGLTDYIEALLGTNINNIDTDQDGITDTLEVEGFDYNSVMWYTDPAEKDTNRDGLSDGQEWFGNVNFSGLPADSDNDGTPDLFDYDNDNDGVPDKTDLSPYSFDDSVTYDEDNPFSLVLNGLNPGKLTYVELQLRPVISEHLRYAYHMIDWPEDKQGNIQDGNDSHDDVQLLPMLEIIVPDTSSHLLPMATLEQQYNILVQDLPDSNQAIYVPLHLATENKGDQNYAFNGKMVYNGAAHWGEAHQYRLVWVVQANNDVCQTFDDAGLCSDYGGQFDQPQVIGTYDDSWQITGINVRENYKSDVATVYEDPAMDANLLNDTPIWHLSDGLNLSFMAAGVVTRTGRLWDIDEIAYRFDHNTNGSATIDERWNITDTLSVYTASYTHQDEALMTTVQTTTKNLLTNHFSPFWSVGNPISPTLLFARQDTYRSFNLDEASSTTSAWQNNQLELTIPEAEVPVEIASTLSWAPYQYDASAAEWESYPIDKYWDYLGGLIAPAFAGEYADPEEADGAALLAQIYYTSLMNGVSNIVQVADQALTRNYYGTDKPIGFSIARGAGVIGQVYLTKKLVAKFPPGEGSFIFKFLHREVRNAAEFRAANPVGTTTGALKGLATKLQALKGFQFGAAAAVTFLVVAAILVGVGFLISEWISGQPSLAARIITAVVVGVVTTVLGIIAPLAQISAFASLFKEAAFGGLTTAQAFAEAATSAEAVSKAAKIAAAVGLVIAIGISWGIFIYAVTSGGGIAPGSVAFNTLLAQAIAATIIAVVQFVLSLTLIGAVIIAILGIIDLLLFILGVDFSLTGWITEQLGKFIYHFELTIAQDIDTGEPELTLVDPEMGMIEGAIMNAAMTITTNIVHDDPDDFWGWRVLPYLPAYYTRSNLRSTTFKYTLTTVPTPFNVGRDAMRGGWNPVVTDHELGLHDMYRGSNVATPATNITLEAGINKALPLYLNSSYALPGVECWTVPIPVWPYAAPVCVDKTIQDKDSSDVGSYLILDVLPDTLEAFLALDWGDDLPFPTQPDYDNDGLVTRALNGNDPDDNNWDSDNDGLADGYELEMRAAGTPLKPLNPDGDADGLADLDEVRFGTDPSRRDTDLDGLDDADEVWHLDTVSGNWEGGWLYTATYTNAAGLTDQTFVTRVFSDPLVKDFDEDGLSDGVERALHTLSPDDYPYHPRVYNESPIGIYLAVSDEDLYVAPDQTFTISATVQNNLVSPLYAMGTHTMTLPAEIGGGFLDQSFNLFKAQATTLITDVTVLSGAASGAITVTTGYTTRLHNDNLDRSYTWRTPTRDIESLPSGQAAFNASLATIPGVHTNDYAMAAVEGANNRYFTGIDVLGNGRAMARPADATIGGRNPIDVLLPDGGTDHDNWNYLDSKVDVSPPAIACNAAGNCAEAYVAPVWQGCADVYFDYMHVTKEDDAGDVGEYGLLYRDPDLYEGFPFWVPGVIFWGWTNGDNGDDLTINKTQTICVGDEISAYEEDPAPNNDDKLGTLTFTAEMLAPHNANRQFKSGDDVTVYYEVLPNPSRTGALRLLDTNLNPAGGTNYVTINLGLLGNPRVFQVANPAVATSGNNWLAGFESTGYVFWSSGIYVMSVNNNGSGKRVTRIDNDTKYNRNLDLAWNDNSSKYLAVWETDYSTTDHDIYMALLNQNGTVNSRRNVDLSNTYEREPSVAYSPRLNQALLVYVSGSKIVGRFIEGGSVGTRFDIATLGAGENRLAEPEVAYDITNNVWIVSWAGANTASAHIQNFHYKMLLPGTLNGGPAGMVDGGVLPAINPIGSVETHSLACSNDGQFQDLNYARTTQCAIVTSAREFQYYTQHKITLDSIRLDMTPPWIGGGAPLVGSETALLTVDADVPTATLTSVSPNETVVVTDTFIIGGDADDPTSDIAQVAVSIDGGAWEVASGTLSWAYAWDTPLNDGPHTIAISVTDVVGHVGTEGPITIYLDRSAPVPTITGSAGDLVPTTQDGNGRWHLSFAGGMADQFSNVAAIQGSISPSGSGWQTATLSGPNSWTLDYVLPEFDENANRVVNPTGDFTLSMRAIDALGNVTAAGSHALLSFKLDTTPPEADLTYFGPTLGVISDTITLSGVFTDPGAVSSGLQQLEIEFVPIISETVGGWTPVTLAASGPGVTNTTWTHPVPDLEGNYLINLRGTDGQGNQSPESDWLTGWQGEIDTRAPVITQFTATQRGNGSAAKTNLEATIYDRNLTEAGLEFPCAVRRQDRGYEMDPVLSGLGLGQERLTSLNIACKINGSITATLPITLRVFDLFGHETVQTLSSLEPAAPKGPVSNFKLPAAPSLAPLTLPTIASTVLTPTDESVITDITSPVVVTIGSYAVTGLNALTMTVDGTAYFTTTWQAMVTDTVTTTAWVPPGDGVYVLETVATDINGTLQTETQPVTVTVDTSPPGLTLDASVLTETHRLSSGRFELSGTAVDANLEAVTVSVNGGPPLAAELNDPNWRFVLSPLPLGDPDNATYTVDILANDGGNTTPLNASVTIDVIGPKTMTVTAGYTNGGAPIPVTAGETVTNATGLTLSWLDATDGSTVAGYRAGWTGSPTPTLTALTFYPDASALHTTPVAEATKWYGHFVALDTVGNNSIESTGPIYVDAPTTPDYINPVDPIEGIYRGWMADGCSQIGADYEVARYAPDGAAQDTVQNFYVTWDATHLRLAWTGADWEVDGDLYIYLDTGSGGATAANNPYGAGAAIALPDEGGGQMGADYLIFVEDGDSASLFSWDGSGWIEDQALTAPNFLYGIDGGVETTDLYIPFSLLGSPASMNLVALASEEETLRLWAAMPDHNPLNSARAVNPVAAENLDLPFALTNYYTWTGVGSSGVCPAAGQFENGALNLELAAEPAGVSLGFLHHDLHQLTSPATAALDADLNGIVDTALPLDSNPVPVGLGQTVSYVLHYANNGSEDVTGVVATVTAAGGLSNLSDTTINLGTIPAGSSGSYTFTADINPAGDGESAELKIAIADNTHVPFDWLWMQHDIDSVAPIGAAVELPVGYIGANETTLYGVVSDVSAVPEITLRINGSTTQTCIDPTPRDGRWSCLFDAGGATDGAAFTFDALGTDEWGNTGTSYGPPLMLVVDTNPPVIALGTESSTALSDGILSGSETRLSGTVTDDRAAGGAEICALAAGETEQQCVTVAVSSSGQPTANWSAEVPLAGSADGETYTLTLYGIDSAGNHTATPLTYPGIIVDTTGPDIVVTNQRKNIGRYSTVTALSGTIADGSGITNLTLQVTRPDNADNVQNEFSIIPLTFAGGNWSYTSAFDREGNYQFGLISSDIHGNETILGTFTSHVVDLGVNVPPEADTGGPYDVDEGNSITLAGTMDDLNLIVGQVITPSWDLNDDGIFEVPAILDPVFDATNIDGPDQRTIRLRVTDGQYTTTVSSLVSIRNLNPTANAGGPYTVTEGATLALIGSGADPFPGDTISFTWDLDENSVFDDAYGAATVYDATNIDGPAYGEVSLKVTDDDGGFTVSTTPITITNAPPELANLVAAPIDENRVATLTGEIVSASTQDTYELEVIWGDGRGSTVATTPATAAAEGIALVPGSAAGNQVLRLNGEVFSEAGFQHRFASGNTWVSQDWSSYDGVSFWYYGVGNSTTVFVEVYDNRNPGSTIDDAERWRYEFSDDTAGWQQISLLFTDFERVEDEVGAPNDGLGLTEVWGWALGTTETDGIETRYVDDFSLTGVSGATIVDDFENGLPDGTDPNGIAVGFSTRRAGWDGTDYFNFPAGTTTFTVSHLYVDDDADDSYTVNLLIRDDDGGENTYNTPITVYNVAPVVTFTPATQDVQYSDVIAPIMITATDVVSDPLGISTYYQVNGGFPAGSMIPGLSLTPGDCVNNNDYTQTCSWTVTGIADVPAGDYVLSAQIADGDDGFTLIEISLTVAAEQTSLKFDGENPVAVQVDAPESNASEPFSLVVTVEELEPDLAAYLAAPGNISLANVSIVLEPVGPGGMATGICTSILTGTGDSYDDYLTTTCAFDDVPVNTYTIALLVDGGYYAGYAEDVIVIYDPSLGFTTGGGWFYWPGSEDPATGYPGDKTNFGYTMKYNNPLIHVQGNLLLIRHLSDGSIYRLKSNAIEGLSLGDVGFFGWASFAGKGTYMEPGWEDPIGNHTFLFYVEDHDEPGNGIDRVWVEVRDKDEIVIPVMSMTRPGSANAVEIDGGNIVVPHSGGTGNNPPTADFSYATNGLQVDFIDESTDPGGSIVAWEWDFGDGNTTSVQNPSHTYAAEGTYDVLLTVTDDEGAQDTTAQQVTVSASGGSGEMYIGDLQGSSTSGNGNKWNAHVTILVLDELGNPVEDALVTGSWSDGASGTSTCQTNSSGLCPVTKSNINGNRNSVTFTVDEVTHTSLTYNPLLNVVTSIIVLKPL